MNAEVDAVITQLHTHTITLLKTLLNQLDVWKDFKEFTHNGGLQLGISLDCLSYEDEHIFSCCLVIVSEKLHQLK